MTKREKLEKALKADMPEDLRVNMVVYIRSPRWSGFLLVTDMTADHECVLGYRLKVLEHDDSLYVTMQGKEYSNAKYIRAIYGRTYPSGSKEYAPLDSVELLGILRGRPSAHLVWEKDSEPITAFELEEALGKPLEISDGY